MMYLSSRALLLGSVKVKCWQMRTCFTELSDTTQERTGLRSQLEWEPSIEARIQRFEEDNEQILSASRSPIENDEVGRVSHASLRISARRHVEGVASRDKKGSSLRFEVIRSDMPMLDGALKPLDCYLGTEDEYDSLVGQDIWLVHIRGGCWMMLRGVHDGTSAALDYV